MNSYWNTSSGSFAGLTGAEGVVRFYDSSKEVYIVDILNGPRSVQAGAIKLGNISPYPKNASVILVSLSTSRWVILGELPTVNSSGSEPSTNAVDAAISALLEDPRDIDVPRYRPPNSEKIIQAEDQFMGTRNRRSFVHVLRSGSILIRAAAGCLRFFNKKSREIKDLCKRYVLSVPGFRFEAGLPSALGSLSSAKLPTPEVRLTQNPYPGQPITETVIESRTEGGFLARIGQVLRQTFAAESGTYTVETGATLVEISPLTGITLNKGVTGAEASVTVADDGVTLSHSLGGTVTIGPSGISVDGTLPVNIGSVAAVNVTSEVSINIGAPIITQASTNKEVLAAPGLETQNYTGALTTNVAGISISTYSGVGAKINVPVGFYEIDMTRPDGSRGSMTIKGDLQVTGTVSSG